MRDYATPTERAAQGSVPPHMLRLLAIFAGIAVAAALGTRVRHALGNRARLRRNRRLQLTAANIEPNARVKLVDGVRLPFKLHGTGGPIRLIVGHGLGQNKDKDSAVDAVATAFTSGLLSSSEYRALSYDARGHGKATGWESCDSSMFHWRELAQDMLAVADAHGLHRFVAMGSSMGAATALFAALQAPERVEAIVMVRPPTAWETREARKPKLLDGAAQARAKGRTQWARVLAGAAEADLPPARAAEYRALAGIPVLILCHGEDDVHPVATGVALSTRLLPTHELSRIVVSSNLAEGEKAWPRILAEWMEGLP